jgi:hypothetical protein
MSTQHEEVSTEIEEGRDYRKWELNLIADQLLRDDSKREVCRQCDGEEKLNYGDETGVIEPVPLYNDKGEPKTDKEDNQLYAEVPELECSEGHRWYQGEGKERSIGGANPILFEEHLQQRRRREIYNTQGVPDPQIKSGIYNRIHPQGRKVNSAEQRKKNGASFYR